MATPSERISALEKKIKFLESLFASLGKSAESGKASESVKRIATKVADAAKDAKETAAGVVGAVKDAAEKAQ